MVDWMNFCRFAAVDTMMENLQEKGFQNFRNFQE